MTKYSTILAENLYLPVRLSRIMKKILSIDGGGIRGIIPGMVLVALEERLKLESKNPDAAIVDYFDFCRYQYRRDTYLSIAMSCRGKSDKTAFFGQSSIRLIPGAWK